MYIHLLTNPIHPSLTHTLQSLHRICVGVIILGVNTLYINFCLFKQIPMAYKGLSYGAVHEIIIYKPYIYFADFPLIVA